LDARTGEEYATVDAPCWNSNWVNVCFSPDSRLLTIQDYGGYDGPDLVRYWDVREERHREGGGVFRGDTSQVRTTHETDSVTRIGFATE
jgi:hypothetical protein